MRILGPGGHGSSASPDQTIVVHPVTRERFKYALLPCTENGEDAVAAGSSDRVYQLRSICERKATSSDGQLLWTSNKRAPS